jgi:hypothetical protein
MLTGTHVRAAWANCGVRGDAGHLGAPDHSSRLNFGLRFSLKAAIPSR